MKRFIAVLMLIACLGILVSCGDDIDNNSTTIKGVLNTSELFTTRDLKQDVVGENITEYMLDDYTDIHITEEGYYSFSGKASEVTIFVEADDTAKVQLILDGVSITNSDYPCIYVESADKVFITTTNSDNSLEVSGDFERDSEGNKLDATIYSKTDLIFNGRGNLDIVSPRTAISGKDDIKFTGGSYEMIAGKNAVRANDSICIKNGNFILTAGTDGFHAENADDDSLGYIYIGGGTISILASDDAIHGQSVVQIDDGTIDLQAREGIEGTYVQINGGTLNMDVFDDGINGANKSSAYNTTIEINAGELNLNLKSDNTDAIDSNRDIIINGGIINIIGKSTFDYIGEYKHNGGIITLNGEEIE